MKIHVLVEMFQGVHDEVKLFTREDAAEQAYKAYTGQEYPKGGDFEHIHDDYRDTSLQVVDLPVEVCDLLKASEQLLSNAIDMDEAFDDDGNMHSDYQALSDAIDGIQPDEEQKIMFTNYYRCSCGEEWEDQWTATCDDRCPKCNTPISPYESEEMES